MVSLSLLSPFSSTSFSSHVPCGSTQNVCTFYFYPLMLSALLPYLPVHIINFSRTLTHTHTHTHTCVLYIHPTSSIHTVQMCTCSSPLEWLHGPASHHCVVMSTPKMHYPLTAAASAAASACCLFYASIMLTHLQASTFLAFSGFHGSTCINGPLIP